jgi:tetratricopeptide (TPR) repeat protein
MRTFAIVSSIVVLAPLAARAEEAAPPAAAPPHRNAHLMAAERLYEKLDLEASLAELQQAEAQANEDDTVAILIYRGLIFADEAKTNEATDQFKRALAIRPWAEVPADTSPRIVKTFSDARKSLWGSSVKPPKKSEPAPVPAEPAQQAAAAAQQTAPGAETVQAPAAQQVVPAAPSQQLVPATQQVVPAAPSPQAVPATATQPGPEAQPAVAPSK